MAEPPRETQGDRVEEPIEGGVVEELSEYRFQPEKHKAETARFIAYFLIFSLVGSWVLHYVTSAWLMCAGHCDIAINLTEDFRNWLPVISASAGGAVTYYFTREK